MAGLRAVEALRKASYDGMLTLVGAEPDLPYDRPPLSKQVLTGEIEPEATAFRAAAHFAALDVDLRLGRPASSLDLERRRVRVDDEQLPFDGLIITTGAHARRLPGTEALEGVHVMRTASDARAIRDAFGGSPRVVVIGAGFIGAEVAASARANGLDVTIVEALPQPLARAIGTEMGAACVALHHDNGTTVRCGVGVDSLEGGRRVEKVHLADGTIVEADLVVVGIGVVPATDWLAGSGLSIGNGVECDETLNAGPPGVFGAGDVASWHNVLYDCRMRVEHWTNAAEQAGVAARNLLAGADQRRPYAGVPYFWSDQYGVRIQFAGRAASDDIQVVDGSIASHRFVALYRSGEQVAGVIAMDSPKVFMAYKAKLARGTAWEDAVARTG